METALINSKLQVKVAGIDSHENDIRRYEEELTEDLWIEILLRLPVKSLLLVTCVCKHWYGLVKDPSFTLKHLQLQKMIGKDNGHFLINQRDFINKEVNYLLFDGEAMSNGTSSNHYLLHHSGELLLRLEGPINGLYCLHNYTGRILIWNPSTNEVGFLPFPKGVKLSLDSYDPFIGFGIDPMDDQDYKVIYKFCVDTSVDEVRSHDMQLMLYTTRTNTWRLLDDELVKLRDVHHSLNNTYLNGFYYWKVEDGCSAFAFDMSKEETFREISTPSDGEFTLHDDHINLFFLNRDLNVIDIWVMLEEKNWLKKYSVTGFQENILETLGFWKTESEILIGIDRYPQQGSQTLLHNITTGKLRKFGPPGYEYRVAASIYYESLVSLSGGITKYKGQDCYSLSDKVWNFFRDDST